MLGDFWNGFFKKAGLDVGDAEVEQTPPPELKRTVSDAGPELARLSSEVDRRSFFDSRRAE